MMEKAMKTDPSLIRVSETGGTHLGILTATGRRTACAELLKELPDLAIAQLFEWTIFKRLLANTIRRLSSKHNVFSVSS